MRIFIEGEKGIGKTTLLKTIVKKSGKKAGGFSSYKLVDDEQKSVGFYIDTFNCNIKSDVVLQKDFKQDEKLFMRGYPENRSVDLRVFDRIDEIVGDFSEIECFVMDEIGGLELLSRPFLEFLDRVFKSSIPCIGTFKSFKNFEYMKQKVDVEFIGDPSNDFRERLINDYGAKILTLTDQNKAEIENEILNAIK